MHWMKVVYNPTILNTIILERLQNIPYIIDSETNNHPRHRFLGLFPISPHRSAFHLKVTTIVFRKLNSRMRFLFDKYVWMSSIFANISTEFKLNYFFDSQKEHRVHISLYYWYTYPTFTYKTMRVEQRNSPKVWINFTSMVVPWGLKRVSV